MDVVEGDVSLDGWVPTEYLPRYLGSDERNGMDGNGLVSRSNTIKATWNLKFAGGGFPSKVINALGIRVLQELQERTALMEPVEKRTL